MEAASEGNAEVKENNIRSILGGSKANTGTVLSSKPDTNDESDSVNLVQLRDSLTQVEGYWKDHLSKINELITESKRLESSPDSITIISSLTTLVSEANKSLQLVQKFMESYGNQLRTILESIGQVTIGQKILVRGMPVIVIDNIEDWLRQQTKGLKDFSLCEKTILKYRDINEKLKIHKVGAKWEGPFKDLITLIAWLNQSIEHGEKTYKESEKIEHVHVHREDVSEDLNWNPYDDEIMGHEGWAVLCSPLQKEIVTPHIIGIALREIFDKGAPEYFSLIDDVLDGCRTDIVRTCKILSVLSRIQIKKLWDSNARTRPALILCLINSWFNDPSNIEYWYWKPLNVVST